MTDSDMTPPIGWLRAAITAVIIAVVAIVLLVYVPNAVLTKWHGRTRWQITVRSPDPAELLRDLKLTEGWTLDIDPASMA